MGLNLKYIYRTQNEQLIRKSKLYALAIDIFNKDYKQNNGMV